MAKQKTKPAPDFDKLAETVFERGEEKKKAAEAVKTTKAKRPPTIARVLKRAPEGCSWAEATRFVLGGRGFESAGLDAMTDEQLGELLRVGRRVAWLMGSDKLRKGANNA